MAADESGRIDIGLVDRDDLEALARGAPGLGGDERGGAVAGAQIEDPGAAGRPAKKARQPAAMPSS